MDTVCTQPRPILKIAPVIFVRLNGVLISRPTAEANSNHQTIIHPHAIDWIEELLTAGAHIVIYSGASRRNVQKIIRHYFGDAINSRLSVLTQEQLGNPHNGEFTIDAQKYIFLARAGAAAKANLVYFVDHEPLQNMCSSKLILIEQFTNTHDAFTRLPPIVWPQQAREAA